MNSTRRWTVWVVGSSVGMYVPLEVMFGIEIRMGVGIGPNQDPEIKMAGPAGPKVRTRVRRPKTGGQGSNLLGHTTKMGKIWAGSCSYPDRHRQNLRYTNKRATAPSFGCGSAVSAQRPLSCGSSSKRPVHLMQFRGKGYSGSPLVAPPRVEAPIVKNSMMQIRWNQVEWVNSQTKVQPKGPP